MVGTRPYYLRIQLYNVLCIFRLLPLYGASVDLEPLSLGKMHFQLLHPPLYYAPMVVAVVSSSSAWVALVVLERDLPPLQSQDIFYKYVNKIYLLLLTPGRAIFGLQQIFMC